MFLTIFSYSSPISSVDSAALLRVETLGAADSATLETGSVEVTGGGAVTGGVAATSGVAVLLKKGKFTLLIKLIVATDTYMVEGVFVPSPDSDFSEVFALVTITTTNFFSSILYSDNAVSSVSIFPGMKSSIRSSGTRDASSIPA